MKNIESQKNKKIETYWSIVWKQFRKKKSAIISVWIIVFFFFIAIFAPLLANNRPLILYTTYGEHYQYNFESFMQNHINYEKSILNYKDNINKQKITQDKFDRFKNEIYSLNQQNDRLGNCYSELNDFYTELNNLSKKGFGNNLLKSSLKEDIKSFSEEKDRLGECFKSINSIINRDNKTLENNVNIKSPSENNIDTIKKLESLVDKTKKTVGANQLTLEEKMHKINAEQDKVNIQLVQLKTRLNYKKSAKLILESLEELKFPVSSNVQNEIEKYIEKYQLFLSKYEKDIYSINLGEFKAESDNIYNEAVNNLSYRFIKASDYVKKLSFPAIRALSFLDIIFMLTILFFMLLPLINKIIKQYFYDRKRIFWVNVLIYFVLITVSGILFVSIRSNRFLPTDYKKLLVSNFLNPSKENDLRVNLDKIIDSKDDYAIYPLIPFGVNENVVEEKYQGPKSFWEKGRHFFGTDSTGRDVLSRMIWGARISLSIGFVAVSIYVFIGIIFGAVAGYFGGWVDMIISRIIEIVICFPSFFLILTIIAFVGPSIWNIMIIIGLTSWTGIARLVRGEFLRLRDQDFVVAARSLGVPNFKIIFKHILPNGLTPVLVSATFGIASAMLIEAGLSFLGFGVREPDPSWGQMISKGQSDALTYWWLSIIPGLAIFISVTVYNLVGDALREAIDPRLKE
ncbi:MAG: ABC transporter permease subunit [Spirochaetota bacterium]|nr:ABC transporter permease subunit [Spirochaetota bacterium]